MRASNTPSSRDLIEFEFKFELKKRLMEWKRKKMEKIGQGMEFIEKTRWKRNNTVGVERIRRVKRRMNEIKKFEDNQAWKDQKRH